MRPESVPLVEPRFEWLKPRPDYLAPINETTVAMYSPSDEHFVFYSPPPNLYEEFAKLVFAQDFPSAAHQFVKNWGFLGVPRLGKGRNSEDLYEEELSAWCYFSLEVLYNLAVLPSAKSPPNEPPLRRLSEDRFQITKGWRGVWERVHALRGGREPNFQLVSGRIQEFWPRWQKLVTSHRPQLCTSPLTRIEVNIPTEGASILLGSGFASLLEALELNVWLYVNPFVKAPHLSVYPKNLLGFMYLHLIKDLVAAYFPQGRLCAGCNEPMAMPRPNQLYCSARCRKRAFRERKRSR